MEGLLRFHVLHVLREAGEQRGGESHPDVTRMGLIGGLGPHHPHCTLIGGEAVLLLCDEGLDLPPVRHDLAVEDADLGEDQNDEIRSMT